MIQQEYVQQALSSGVVHSERRREQRNLEIIVSEGHFDV